MAKPIVNGIEQDLQDRAKVIRLNILSRLGKEVASLHGVEVVPTTIILDANGKLIYQHAGLPNRKAVVDRIGAA